MSSRKIRIFFKRLLRDGQRPLGHKAVVRVRNNVKADRLFCRFCFRHGERKRMG